ncbi:MAG: hypothetical protein LBU34_05045 [Planctomycetaceae bacterium]|jgi:hypothetical protein|nr:hypothetical protein [Planctomycetaceae bacterium]
MKIKYFHFFFCFCFLFFTELPLAGADEYLLKEGGKIKGELLNIEEVPRKTYRILADKGAEVGIASKYIERPSKGERDTILEYNAFAPFEEDTVENHLKIADWCSKHQLPELARQHWNRILEHDPEHKSARSVLGYIKGEDGSWITQRELLGSRGLVKHNGSWKTQQQIDIERILEKRKQAETNWEKKITAWRTALPNHAKAKSEILAVTDSPATTALWNALSVEENDDTRILLLKALSNIGTSPALHNIARWSMNTRENTEVRLACFDEIRKHPAAKQALVGFYASFLNSQHDIATINAAAFGLGEIGGRSAIPQLIDALITVHTETKIINAPAPAFGSFGNTSGTQFAWGTLKKNEVHSSQNQEVLTALIKLSGVNFQYNKNAWRAWLIESRRTASFNARRG